MVGERVLGGRYVVAGLLGRGGMAEVHLARDQRLDRPVAVKVLRPDLAADTTSLARFRREVLSAASLNHPGIVAVYDSGEDTVGGRLLPYLVMELVGGTTLAELLHEGSPLTALRALELTGGILDALAYAHAQGIVHRDIKPANVMLVDGQTKVMDFGIARPLGADSGMTLTQHSMVVGTAEYLSPEQARGEQVDARADLYSTGCLLYELLTGRRPFLGDSPMEVAWHHLRTEPEPPSVHASAVPHGCDQLVLRALKKDRDLRFGSAEEMREALDACVRSLTVHTPTALQPRQEQPPRERPRPARSLMRRLVLAGTVCAVLVAGAGAYAASRAGGGTHAVVHSPALTGKSLLQARLSARFAGLHVTTVTTGGCTELGVPAHHVCGQSPAPGSDIARGSGISLTIAPADSAG
jgi:serine/threonine protein kinase